MAKRAVVLLSGGLDSSVALFVAREAGYELHALTFQYGQRHSRELECARWQAAQAGASTHRVVDLSLAQWGGSSLTDEGLAIEAGNLARLEAPNTYVPARNMVFIAVAASMAEAIGAEAIYLGVSEADYSGYVDCRAEFLKAMEAAVNLGTERKTLAGRPMALVAPFLHMRKPEEIALGRRLGVDFGHTWSCYAGEETPCGRCDSCLLRARAFSEAGLPDPLLDAPRARVR